MDMERMIDAIASRVPVDGDTYEENGLLYCAKCRTARQVQIEIFGKVKTVPCICKCMAEARDREEEERRRYEQALELQRFRDMGFPDRELQSCTFSADDGQMPEITRAMKAYTEQFKYFRKEGKGLLLYGPTGTGKTFQAACVVNALIEKGYPCLMTDFSRLTNKINGMRWEDRPEYIDSLSKFALVAIDDLGVERDTEFMNENVTTIINSLYRANVPMIITSNHSPKQLTGETEIRRQRVYDRLLERCFPVEVNGPSRRKQKGRDDYADMKSKLGL